MPDEATPDAPLYPPGTVIGRYRIVRPIGEGGMGAVYEATHTDLQKRVAVKILRPEVARVAASRARFLREGQAAASIHHPHVAEVFDVGQDNGALYLVMEYLEGENLYEHLYQVGALTVVRCVDLLLPVCAALAVAHEQRIVHRDVKPENVFLARTRHGAMQPKLLDFGISKVPVPGGGRITATATLLGTPHYMSPEQARERGDVDARSDQYAFGVMLYECVTGRRPFEGDALYPLLHAIVNTDPVAPRSLRPDLPADFEALVLRAMARDPESRFVDMHGLGRALLPFASPALQEVWRPVFGDPFTPPSSASRPSLDTPTIAEGTAPVEAPRPRWRAFVAGGALMLCVLGAVLFVVTRRPPTPRPTFARAVVSPPSSPPVVETPPALAPVPVAVPPLSPSAPVVAAPLPRPTVVTVPPVRTVPPLRRPPPTAAPVHATAPRGANHSPIVE